MKINAAIIFTLSSYLMLQVDFLSQLFPKHNNQEGFRNCLLAITGYSCFCGIVKSPVVRHNVFHVDPCVASEAVNHKFGSLFFFCFFIGTISVSFREAPTFVTSIDSPNSFRILGTVLRLTTKHSEMFVSVLVGVNAKQ